MDANKSFKFGLVLYLLSTAAVAQDLPNTKVLIVVYDAAHVGPKTLGRTERLVGSILSTAGVQASWNTGQLEDLEHLGIDVSAHAKIECQTAPLPATLRAQILPHAPAGLATQALGFSLPCATRGIQVTIYADRVANVSETGGPTFGRVLAYVMAHELGHMLLHSGHHEAAGLMKGTWSKSDWQAAAVSISSFSPLEMQRIAAFKRQVADPNVAQLTPPQAP